MGFCLCFFFLSCLCVCGKILCLLGLFFCTQETSYCGGKPKYIYIIYIYGGVLLKQNHVDMLMEKTKPKKCVLLCFLLLPSYVVGHKECSVDVKENFPDDAINDGAPPHDTFPP